MSVESNIFIPMQSTNQGSIISVRTSDAQMQSIAPSGGQVASYTTRTQMARSVSSTVFNQGSSSAYSVKGTTSFMAISSEVGGQVCTQDNLFDGPAQLRGRAYAARPDRPPVGQEVPMGDLLLPLLLMSAGYLFIKLFRNRKKSQAL